MLYSLYITNSTGLLIYHHHWRQTVLSINDQLKLGSSMYANIQIANSIANNMALPVTNTHYELENYKMYCINSTSGVGFYLVSDDNENLPIIASQILKLYCDYVMKDPFHTPDQPIKSSKFITRISQL